MTWGREGIEHLRRGLAEETRVCNLLNAKLGASGHLKFIRHGTLSPDTDLNPDILVEQDGRPVGILEVKLGEMKERGSRQAIVDMLLAREAGLWYVLMVTDNTDMRFASRGLRRPKRGPTGLLKPPKPRRLAERFGLSWANGDEDLLSLIRRKTNVA